MIAYPPWHHLPWGGQEMQVSLKTYRDAFPGRWAVFWLLLPNLTVMLMWFIGGPPMTPALALFGLAALVLAQFPWTWPKRLALAGMIGQLTYYYVCALFNLDTKNIAMLPGFLREVRPMRSPEYVLAAACFLAATVISLVWAPRVRRFRTPMSYLLGFCVLFAFVAVDFAATASTRGSYHSAPPAGAAYSSATKEAGVAMPAAAKHNLVVVVVESLGVPLAATPRAMFEADWNRPAWRARYDVRQGTIPYFGATTNGEVRELCERWGNYYDTDFTRANCLPARYSAAGYETTGIHGFAGWFFDRQRWYPQLGFQHSLFEDDLLAAGAGKCPGVFSGACDTAVPAIVLARLKRATKPQFVYWMTLNTHLPVLADSSLKSDWCDRFEVDWSTGNAQACRLFVLHHELADAIDALAMDPHLPPTDFVVVGDHMPPFLDRGARGMFDNARVPWLYLRSRDPGAKTSPSAKSS
jgi:hypothetical protein